MKRQFAVFLALFVALLGAGTHGTWAKSGDAANTQSNAVAEGYLFEKSAASYRTTSGDNTIILFGDYGNGTSTTSVAGITTFLTGGKPTVAISGRFSGAAATVTATVLRYTIASGDHLTGTLTFQGKETITLTSDAKGRDAAGLYPSDEVAVDTRGAQIVKVVIWLASGTVDLWVRNY